jgi:hypothetical protein
VPASSASIEWADEGMGGVSYGEMGLAHVTCEGGVGLDEVNEGGMREVKARGKGETKFRCCEVGGGGKFWVDQGLSWAEVGIG